MGRTASRACVYCGAEATTRDHVVPRCLLEREYPDNLPTVPCCRVCNEERSRDEQYFAVALAQVGFHPTLQDKLAPRGTVDRALERSPRLDDRIIESLSVAADGRVYFAPEMDRMASVAQKVAFGLYCHRYQLGKVPAIREFRTVPLTHSEEAMNHIFVMAHTERFVPRRWTDLQKGVFSYMFVRNWVWADIGKLVCIMSFYETLWAAVVCPWPSRGSGARKRKHEEPTVPQASLFMG
jgi:hypothetical protein